RRAARSARPRARAHRHRQGRRPGAADRRPARPAFGTADPRREERVMGLTVIIIIALAVAFPLAMISAAEMYKRRLAFKERELELAADRTAETAAQYAAQVKKLEERMRVLERIATDRGVDVAH